MRVLFWMPVGFDVPGGHKVQMSKTARAIADTGVDVAVSTDPAPNLKGIDIVHGFGLRVGDVRLARQAGCRVALSTIYWPVRYTHGLEGSDSRSGQLRRRVRRAGAAGYSALRGQHLARAERTLANVNSLRLAFESADLLLPNAAGELADIQADLAVTTPGVVIPNAIDAAIFLVDDPPSSDRRRGVLCVGRIEPHKNQLALAKACQTLGQPLTLVGAEHPHHLGYLEMCREAMPTLEWVPEIDQAGLVTYYDNARVHVLCSWFETTGLSNLEGAARGCSLVSTSRGYAQEYFGDGATYCDPSSQRSICQAIEQAIDRTACSGLRDRLTTSFTWEATAHATAGAYLSLS